MAVAAGLDITKKHFTKLISVQKTMGKVPGVSATGDTWHKNQKSSTDYDELDDDDHRRLSKILSSDKSTAVNWSRQESLPDHTVAILHTFSQLQLLNPLMALPNNCIMPSALAETNIIFLMCSDNMSDQFQKWSDIVFACFIDSKNYY